MGKRLDLERELLKFEEKYWHDRGGKPTTFSTWKADKIDDAITTRAAEQLLGLDVPATADDAPEPDESLPVPEPTTDEPVPVWRHQIDPGQSNDCGLCA